MPNTQRRGVAPDRLLRDLDDLAQFGGAPGLGVSRPAFSPAMHDAVRWLMGRMTAAGLRARIDAAGNVIGRMGPESAPAIVCGSHIDSVPRGGRLDGALGVMAALECARQLAAGASSLPLAFEVVAFADEEGAYLSLLGARAMVGTVTVDQVNAARGRDGRPLAEAMAAAKLMPEHIAQAARAPSSIAAYVELHIEQGPVLADSACQIGIVTAINEVEATEYLLKGAARHAGTTPMAARRDAAKGACAAITAAFAQFEREGRAEDRMTFGVVELQPGARNVVPGSARIVSEVRSDRAASVAALRQMVDQAMVSACAREGLVCSQRPLGRDTGVAMDRGLRQSIRQSCERRGYSHREMPSGAGHDAQAFAPLVPTAMVFVPSHEGISHHPDEHTAADDIERGANVLLDTIFAILDGTATPC